MANSNVQEIPISADVQAGADHPHNTEVLVQGIAQQLGKSESELTPLNKKEDVLDKSNLDNFLDTMGAKEKTEAPVGNDTSSAVDDFEEAVKSILPGGNDDTVRFVSGGVGDKLEAKRKEQMGD